MSRIREFTKKLFSLRNLFPVLIIIIAIIGSLNAKPFGLEISTNQIIMALLAFLAVDSLVERLDLLATIDDGIKELNKKLTPQTAGADIVLRKRKDFPRMESLINEAHGEIWIVGLTLDTMVTQSAYFNEKTKLGCNIRILSIAPSGDSMQEISKYYATDRQFTSKRAESNLSIIASRVDSSNKGNLEIRVLDRVFTTGYLISDPETPKGKMIVQSYLYGIGSSQSPIFELSKQSDPISFSLYLTQYENMWKDAVTF